LVLKKEEIEEYCDEIKVKLDTYDFCPHHLHLDLIFGLSQKNNKYTYNYVHRTSGRYCSSFPGYDVGIIRIPKEKEN